MQERANNSDNTVQGNYYSCCCFFSASDVNSDSAGKTQFLADEGFISLMKSQQDNVRHVEWFIFLLSSPHPPEYPFSYQRPNLLIIYSEVCIWLMWWLEPSNIGESGRGPNVFRPPWIIVIIVKAYIEQHL